MQWFTMAQWEQMYGIYGGDIAIAIGDTRLIG